MIKAILWGATALFFLRVAAQLVQSIAPLTFLPSFAQFHGNVLPYTVLLVAQIAILFLMVYLNLRIDNGWRPGSEAARRLRMLGIIYFLVMLFRLAAGSFSWFDHEWFHRPLPAFFHLVLATYIVTLGACSRHSSMEVEK